MADDKVSKNPQESGSPIWVKATVGYERGDGQLEGTYVNASKAGAIEAGVEATALALDMAEELGLPQHSWAFDFYGDTASGQVACVFISLDKATRASGQVRFYEGKGSPRSAWHIGGLLKQHRSLRPKTDVRCAVTRGTGPGGVPALIIPLRSGVAVQTTRRKGEGEPENPATPGNQAAAGETPKE